MIQGACHHLAPLPGEWESNQLADPEHHNTNSIKKKPRTSNKNTDPSKGLGVHSAIGNHKATGQ